MDAIEDDDRKPHQKIHSANRSSNNSNRNPSFPITHNGNHGKYKHDYQKPREEDETESDDEEEAGEDGYSFWSRMRRKKRKMGNVVHHFSFVSGNASDFGQSSPSNWTEHADSVLLETWGERFLKLGKTDLGSDEWWEVAEKVSEECEIGFTRAQCRNRLDELKKKYMREKIKVDAVSGGRRTSKWAFFEKANGLFGSLLSQHCSLPCGIDSGNYAFMESNGLDEMMDSAGESDDDDDDDDDDASEFEGVRGMNNEGLLLKPLADSILKFGRLYKKVESRRSQQMMELQKMRMDFIRDLEMQRRQFLERTMAAISKPHQDDGK